MRISRRFLQTLNVHDPIAFDTDRTSNAKLQLKDQYEGKCFEGYFVEEILAVERLSRTKINRVGDISQGTVEAQFVALCFRYHAGDAIAGMEILNKSAILTGRPAAKLVGVPGQGVAPAALSINEGNETLGVGQFVPVEVVSVQHSAGQSQAAIIVRPLECRKKEYVWKVSQPADAAFREKIAPTLGDFLKLLEERGAILADAKQTSVRQFFSKQLSSYRHEVPLPPSFEPVDLNTKDLILAWAASLKPDTLWTRPLERDYDWVGVCQVVGDADPNRYIHVCASPEIICSVILNALSSAVKVLSDLPKVYHTEALAISHTNVFMAMRKAQIS